MLHLMDGFIVFLLRELAQPPIAEHARMQEVLVDRGEFILENDIEEADDFCISRKGGRGLRPYAALASLCALLSASSISAIVSWHRPQFLLTPHPA